MALQYFRTGRVGMGMEVSLFLSLFFLCPGVSDALTYNNERCFIPQFMGMHGSGSYRDECLFDGFHRDFFLLSSCSIVPSLSVSD